MWCGQGFYCLNNTFYMILNSFIFSFPLNYTDFSAFQLLSHLFSF